MRTALLSLALVACVGPLSCDARSRRARGVHHNNGSQGAELVAQPVPSGCPEVPVPTGPRVPAFPGAEGYGAVARGGRGGSVCYVTTLEHDGDGSLQACLDAEGARYILFKVSGVITGNVEIHHGDVTIAGQTSPGGVLVHGSIYCDNVYDNNTCRNVILRHVRARQPSDDCLRMGGTSEFIVDHCSFENASDESIELSRSHDVTVQNTLIAEPVGDHYHYGGFLINYSKDRFTLDNLSIHHNVWSGVYGRLPEISCEENNDGPGSTNCSGRTLHIDLTNNVLWDAGDPVWYNRCTGTNEGNDCAPSPRNFFLALNFVNNLMARRSPTPEGPMFVNDFERGTGNQAFYSGNQLVQGPRAGVGVLPVPSRGQRMQTPAITVLPTAALLESARTNVGAFPRDPMDTRIVGYLSRPVDQRDPSWANENGIDRGDGLRLAFSTPPPAPADGDEDGMPDAWESAHRLDPRCPGANATTLAASGGGGVEGCTAGYTDLECYLNELSAIRVRTGR